MSRTTRRAAQPQEDLLAKVEPKREPPVAPAKAESKPTPEKKPRAQHLAVVDTRAPAKVVSENLLASLMTAISNPRVDPAKMHALLDVRARVMQEQAQVEFFRAYIRLQGKLPSINKDGLIDQGETKSGRRGSKSRYATYENINAVTNPILAEEKFGLLLLPDVGPEGHGVIIRGQLGFVCDTQYGEIVHIERCTIAVPPEVSGSKNPAQGVGSSLSYGKRYGAIALLNLVSHAPDDRDTDARPPKKSAPASNSSVQEAETIEYLTPKQVEEMNAAINDCRIGVEAFCNHYNIKEVSDLSPHLFAEAKQACSNYKAKQARNG